MSRNEKVCHIRRLKLIDDTPFAIKERIIPLKVARLIGKNDFEAFCKSKGDEKHFLCHIELLKWETKNNDLILRIISNRFLHNMVRIIVGTMIDVGREKITTQYVEKILISKNRRNAGSTVPAHGLCLVKVYYNS